jgi:hypothetical protein
MTLIDLIGWAAAALTLLAFTLRDVCLLRTASPGAGVAFTVYAGVMATWRMLVLLAVLRPINLLRLLELRRNQRPSNECDGRLSTAWHAPPEERR